MRVSYADGIPIAGTHWAERVHLATTRPNRLGEAISEIRVLLREPELGAREVIAAAEFLSEAGEWREAIEALDTLDVDRLDAELTERLNAVPVRTLFHAPAPATGTGSSTRDDHAAAK